jgi:hypothetical protein
MNATLWAGSFYVILVTAPCDRADVSAHALRASRMHVLRGVEDGKVEAR